MDHFKGICQFPSRSYRSSYSRSAEVIRAWTIWYFTYSADILTASDVSPPVLHHMEAGSQLIAFGGEGGGAILCDESSNERIAKLNSPDSTAITSMCFAESNKYVVIVVLH